MSSTKEPIVPDRSKLPRRLDRSPGSVADGESTSAPDDWYCFGARTLYAVPAARMASATTALMRSVFRKLNAVSLIG
jgi:hypothetical protein